MSLWWDIVYWLKKTPWDTGLTPPEIVAMIESGKAPIGRALDLGCGTGTNAIYLAQKGFEVTGLDISGRAISLAKRKARSAQLADRVRLGRSDVTLMRRWALGHSIDFAFDIGCFHNLEPEARARYVAALTAVLKPGAIYMLYAFEPSGDQRGVGLDEIAKLFDRDYKLDGLRHGGDRNSRKSAWYTFKKREA
ncbi:MAG: class I SAM-dependent methyltransferase [Chloroflexi bacterium]|nr:class I SAM-dependent methyltransferase [Chloroflexota bacterium]